LFPDGQDAPGAFIEPKFSNLNQNQTEWNGMLQPDNILRNENCKDSCLATCGLGPLACGPVCDALCDNIKLCDPEKYDERNILEIPATDLTFTCRQDNFSNQNIRLADPFTFTR